MKQHNRLKLILAAAMCAAVLAACGSQSAPKPAGDMAPQSSAASGAPQGGDMMEGSGMMGGSEDMMDSVPGANYEKITPEEAKKLMDQGGVTVVDVRTQQEYDQGHIPGAILIPNETIVDTPPAQLPDKDAVILVYCRSGRRSADAAGKLSAMGYTHIRDLGGIKDWPYETVTK